MYRTRGLSNSPGLYQADAPGTALTEAASVSVLCHDQGRQNSRILFRGAPHHTKVENTEQASSDCPWSFVYDGTCLVIGLSSLNLCGKSVQDRV